MAWSPSPSAEVGEGRRPGRGVQSLGIWDVSVRCPNKFNPKLINKLRDWYLVALSSTRTCGATTVIHAILADLIYM